LEGKRRRRELETVTRHYEEGRGREATGAKNTAASAASGHGWLGQELDEAPDGWGPAGRDTREKGKGEKKKRAGPLDLKSRARIKSLKR